MTPTDPTRPLSAALRTALSVALHESLDPTCSGDPPYGATEQQAAAIADAVMQSPLLLATLDAERAAQPSAALREMLSQEAIEEIDAALAELAALSPAPTPVEPPVEFDPDPRWKPGEHDDLRIFVQLAARNMFVRLREKANVWGRSWRTGYYPDSENIERLQRAVGHLIAANDAAHRDDADPAQMSEPWRRAADVANQAFMLADPSRGWHEDAAQRADRLAATKAGSS